MSVGAGGGVGSPPQPTINSNVLNISARRVILIPQKTVDIVFVESPDELTISIYGPAYTKHYCVKTFDYVGIFGMHSSFFGAL